VEGEQMTKCETYSVLDGRERKRLETRGLAVVCHFCLRPIVEGECFVRKRIHGRARVRSVKYYHEECWRSLLH
jgi:hypothetical protein